MDAMMAWSVRHRDAGSSLRVGRTAYLLDAQGEVVREGRTPTIAPALAAPMRELSREGEVLAGQEVARITSPVPTPSAG